MKPSPGGDFQQWIESLFDLSEDVAVVTGAGRGIGEGIARTLAAAGAAVVVAARRTAEIERVAEAIRAQGARALAVTTDVTDEAAVDALARAAIDAFGRLDIWVNNAGGSPVQSRLTRLSREDWDAAIALNLTAVWVCTTVAARYMRDGGRVVNISSRAAVGPMPGSGHYAAAKAGVNSLTETFAHELGPRIRVNGIMPGAVPTEIMMKALKLTDDDLPKLQKNLRLPLQRLGTPQDLGAAALYLASPASAWVTGHTLTVSGGL
jgi:NAD(P)-dependent dehydrogenase (short-subunit alcohol dehydrogenase family)